MDILLRKLEEILMKITIVKLELDTFTSRAFNLEYLLFLLL